MADREPKFLTIGDTWAWTKSLADYPASVWTLSYSLRSRTAEIDITASASGDDFSISVAKATTAAYQPGLYAWHAQVTDGTTRATIGRGIIDIRPDPAQLGAGYDPRSHARKVLEALRAVMENRATESDRALVAYSIGSRSKTFDTSESKASLVEAISKYEWLVANEEDRERIAAGDPNPRFVGIRFGR